MSRFFAFVLCLLLPLQLVAGSSALHHCVEYQEPISSGLGHALADAQADQAGHDCVDHHCPDSAWAESVSGGFCQDCVSCMGCSIAVNSLRLEMAWAPQISPEPLLSILLSGIFPRVETRPPIKT